MCRSPGLGSSTVTLARLTMRSAVLLVALSIEVARWAVSIATVIAHVPRCEVVMLMSTTVARKVRGSVTVAPYDQPRVELAD